VRKAETHSRTTHIRSTDQKKGGDSEWEERASAKINFRDLNGETEQKRGCIAEKTKKLATQNSGKFRLRGMI